MKQLHGARAWIDHIALVWAHASQATHNHHNGAAGCPTCGPKIDQRHNHDNGIGSCRLCAQRQCGNEACPICAP